MRVLRRLHEQRHHCRPALGVSQRIGLGVQLDAVCTDGGRGFDVGFFLSRVNRLTRILADCSDMNGFFEEFPVLDDIPSVIRSECTSRSGTSVTCSARLQNQLQNDADG